MEVTPGNAPHVTLDAPGHLSIGSVFASLRSATGDAQVGQKFGTLVRDGRASWVCPVVGVPMYVLMHAPMHVRFPVFSRRGDVTPAIRYNSFFVPGWLPASGDSRRFTLPVTTFLCTSDEPLWRPLWGDGA